MQELLIFALLLLILIAGVVNAISACKNPTAYADWARRKYQDKIDRHSGKNITTLTDEARAILVARRQELDSIGLAIDKLRQEKSNTHTEILALIDKLQVVGLAASNRGKYALDLLLAFAVGITTSILGNLLWSHFSN